MAHIRNERHENKRGARGATASFLHASQSPHWKPTTTTTTTENGSPFLGSNPMANTIPLTSQPYHHHHHHHHHSTISNATKLPSQMSFSFLLFGKGRPSSEEGNKTKEARDAPQLDEANLKRAHYSLIKS